MDRTAVRIVSVVSPHLGLRGFGLSPRISLMAHVR